MDNGRCCRHGVSASPPSICTSWLALYRALRCPNLTFAICRRPWQRSDVRVVLVHPQIPQNTGNVGEQRRSSGAGDAEARTAPEE